MIKKKKNRVVLISAFVLGFIILFTYLRREKRGVMEDFNPDTGIKETYEYVVRNGDTILDGKFAEYNKRGVKIAEGNYTNNEIVGEYSHYYNDGTIETKQFKENSKKTIEAVWYNPKGQVNTYTMYDEYGKPCFLIKDMDEKVVLYKGYPLVEIYQYKLRHKEKFNIKSEQNLYIGDVLKYEYLLANIPNTTRQFKIENLSVDDKKVKRVTNKTSPININVEEVLIKKGINTIRAVVQYNFNDKVTPVLRDTVSFDIEVR
jgi:hypothetical protein